MLRWPFTAYAVALADTSSLIMLSGH